MKLNDAIKEFGNVEIDEVEFKKLIKPIKVGRFIPARGERYYAICSAGEITATTNTNCDIDAQLITIGNCYATREEAEFVVGKKLFELKFEEYLRAREDVPVDWSDDDQNKYYLEYFHESDAIGVDYWFRRQQQGTINTTNKEALQQFIKENEKDIRKYLFNLKEEN